jgi:hypothetical protein
VLIFDLGAYSSRPGATDISTEAGRKSFDSSRKTTTNNISALFL